MLGKMSKIDEKRWKGWTKQDKNQILFSDSKTKEEEARKKKIDKAEQISKEGELNRFEKKTMNYEDD